MSLIEVQSGELHIEHKLAVEMKAYNQDTPFIFHKGEQSLVFGIEFVDPTNIMKRITSLRDIDTESISVRETALKAIYHCIQFTASLALDHQRLVEDREGQICFDWQVRRAFPP